jgi:DNA-binding beta-propeller fold protein YncE
MKKKSISLNVAWLMLVTIAVGLGSWGARMPLAAKARKARAREVPVFQVDPSWPKVPNNWVFGEVSSVSVDAQDHVWMLQRPRTLRPAQKSQAAPPVLEFDAAGNFIKAWGGPGEGYEWPANEHGIFLDYKGNVWIGGNDKSDSQLLKFTQDGKFIMQIGHSGQSKGNKDTNNLSRPADAFVYPKTNEVFVADGYGNRRVIVFDADTGVFKRMWGAFGNPPVDIDPNQAGESSARGNAGVAASRPLEAKDDPGPQQFNLVHAARVSNDGLVYVSDRANKRVQVFTIEGKFLKQVFIGRDCEAPKCGNGNTAASTAFSPDAQQRFLYVADRSEGRILVLERKTLEILYSFGKLSQAPGDFNILHHMSIDSKGNLYTTEVNDNFTAGECCRRIQKFVFKGMSSAPMN